MVGREADGPLRAAQGGTQSALPTAPALEADIGMSTSRPTDRQSTQNTEDYVEAKLYQKRSCPITLCPTRKRILHLRYRFKAIGQLELRNLLFSPGRSKGIASQYPKMPGTFSVTGSSVGKNCTCTLKCHAIHAADWDFKSILLMAPEARTTLCLLQAQKPGQTDLQSLISGGDIR